MFRSVHRRARRSRAPTAAPIASNLAVVGDLEWASSKEHSLVYKFVIRDEEPFCWTTLRSKFRDALLFLREQGKPIPDKEARRTASRHFMEKFVAKTSKNASAELIFLSW